MKRGRKEVPVPPLRPGDAAAARLAVRVGCSAFLAVSILCIFLLINLFFPSLEQVRTALRHAVPYFTRKRAASAQMFDEYTLSDQIYILL
jgi:hypothetical protein